METFWTDLQQILSEYYLNFIGYLPRIGIGLVMLILFFLLAGSIHRSLKKILTGRVEDPLLAKFLARVGRTAFLIVGILITLQIIGLGGTAAGLLAGAGVTAFVIGFAFKDIGENLLAGIMLAFNRPFNTGDVVTISGMTGSVIGLSLRNTQIKTFDGKDVFIPNSEVVKNKLINFTIDGFLRFDFSITLDDDDDPDKARQIILDQLKTIDGILQENKPPSAYITDISENFRTLTTYFWVNTKDPNVSGLEVKHQVFKKVMDALNKEGYYLPSKVIELKSFKNSALPPV